MNSRLGFVLSAIFLIFACAMIAPAQAAPLRIGATSACALAPSLHNPPQTPITHTSTQAQLPDEGNVQVQFTFKRANVLHMVQPKYPPEAKAKGIQGKVLLRAIICKDGHVKVLRKISGLPILAKPAIEAVSRWVYEPALRNGKPVTVETEITVIFTLAEDSKGKESHP